MTEFEEMTSLLRLKDIINTAAQVDENIHVMYCPSGPAPRVDIGFSNPIHFKKQLWVRIKDCFEEAGYSTDDSNDPYCFDHLWVEYNYTFSPKAPTPAK